MKNIRFLSIVLLLFTGLNALSSGFLLMSDPSGSLLWLKTEQLRTSVFNDFFIPGVLLFVLIGVLSLVAAAWTIFRWNNYPRIIILQALLILVWIFAQIFTFKAASMPEWVIVLTGALLLICGVRLRELSIRKP